MDGHMSKKEAKILGFKVDGRSAAAQHRTKFVPVIRLAEEAAYKEKMERERLFNEMLPERRVA